jgi:hypothetical protein
VFPVIEENTAVVILTQHLGRDSNPLLSIFLPKVTLFTTRSIRFSQWYRRFANLSESAIKENHRRVHLALILQFEFSRWQSLCGVKMQALAKSIDRISGQATT